MRLSRRLMTGAAAAVLASSMVAAGGGAAYADGVGNFDEVTSSSEMGVTLNGKTLLKTYGVRAGSAGPDFLGISNTNYDFSAGNPSQDTQYDYTSTNVSSEHGLGIWGTVVNENPNPWYWNLVASKLSGTTSGNVATSWMKNYGENSSWGDSTGAESQTPSGDYAIAGLEYSPEIIFGANKKTNWNNFSVANTTMLEELGESGATYANNDATNIWTQIYTMGQLATKANTLTQASGSTKTTRYDGGDATVSAVNYERATRGQLLYVAKNLANGTAKKKVAYLYAINGDVSPSGEASGDAYFFTPKASGLASGTNASTNYAANNSTVNMGYMGTLPLVTDTYDSNVAGPTITMTVEDITKTEPTCALSANTASALADVDVIIYNTNKSLTSAGTSGGKNNEGIRNTGCFASESLLDAAQSDQRALQTWLAKCGFTGTLVAGDDWGTSKNQDTTTCDAFDAQVTNASGETVTIHHNAGQCPVLYCMRNYTADKNARAAWAFAQVYPNLYPDTNASYAFWLKYVYHVKEAYAPAVLKEMTRQASSLSIASDTYSTVYNYAEDGYAWWNGLTSSDSWYHTAKCMDSDCSADASHAAVYAGASRASYYDGDTGSNVTGTAVGIFKPSALWTAAGHVRQTVAASRSDQVVMPSYSAGSTSLSVASAYAYAPNITYTQITLAELNGKVYSGVKFTTKEEESAKYLYMDAATQEEINAAAAADVPTASESDRPGVYAPSAAYAFQITRDSFDHAPLIMYVNEGVTELHSTKQTKAWDGQNLNVGSILKSYIFNNYNVENGETIYLPKSLEVIDGVLNNYCCTVKTQTNGVDDEYAQLPNLMVLGSFSLHTPMMGTSPVTQDEDGSYTASNILGGKLHIPVDCYVASQLNCNNQNLAEIDVVVKDLPAAGKTAAAAAAITQCAKDACVAAGVDYDDAKTPDENLAAAQAAAVAAGKTEQAAADQAALETAMKAAQDQAALDQAAAVKAAQDQAALDQAAAVEAAKADATAAVQVDQKVFAKVAKKTYKYKDVKKAKKTFMIGAQAMTKCTYKVTKGSKYVKVSKAGKVTVKKGAKKGTYTIQVTAAAGGHYKAATKTIKVVVK